MNDEWLIIVNKLYNNCWKLVKEYHNAKTPEEWKACTDRAGELMKEYGEWSMDILLDTMKIIEKSKSDSNKGISQYKADPPIYRKG